MDKLARLATRLKPGAYFISFTHSLKSPYFDEVTRGNFDMCLCAELSLSPFSL